MDKIVEQPKSTSTRPPLSPCSKYFELNRNTGHIYIRSDIPEDELRQPLTLVVRATQFDNADRYVPGTLKDTQKFDLKIPKN